MNFDPDTLRWFKSSASAAGACVEVAHLPNGAEVALRDTKDRSRQPHFFTASEWRAFVAGVKTGEFDLPPAATRAARRGSICFHSVPGARR